ncbi:hypothetical protein D3C73_948670 [compost metagenome]
MRGQSTPVAAARRRVDGGGCRCAKPGRDGRAGRRRGRGVQRLGCLRRWPASRRFPGPNRRESGGSPGTQNRRLHDAARPVRHCPAPRRFPRRSGIRPRSGGRGSRGCSSASICRSRKRRRLPRTPRHGSTGRCRAAHGLQARRHRRRLCGCPKGRSGACAFSRRSRRSGRSTGDRPPAGHRGSAPAGGR